jgi:hypothetical protein
MSPISELSTPSNLQDKKGLIQNLKSFFSLEWIEIVFPRAFNASIYTAIASLALAIASPYVSPSVMHPGREGTVTV